MKCTYTYLTQIKLQPLHYTHCKRNKYQNVINVIETIHILVQHGSKLVSFCNLDVSIHSLRTMLVTSSEPPQSEVIKFMVISRK